MSDSRTRNSKRNIVSGMIKQSLGIVLQFATRTVVLYTLGVQYQGLNSLFTSILHVLNLADLGFSTAVVYVLYKPIAENDRDTICNIIAYLKKVYLGVGIVILVVGVAIMPFLPMLITGEYPDDINIYILYGFYLINAVVSYWLFAYKSALLTAMQREDLVSVSYSITSTGTKLVQIIVVVIAPNYYLYVAVLPLFTIINNILIQYYSKKHFSDIVPKGRISRQLQQDLNKQIKGIVIGKVGDVARNGCDSIFLSAFLGLTALTIYDNYYYIYSAVYSITLTITHAIQASVGNSMAKESKQKNYSDFCKFSFVFSWFTGWCAITMCCLYQPFMLIWMNGNSSMLLSNYNMALFVLYFYVICMNNVRNLYVNGAGLYWELRTWYVAEAFSNIVLNFVLGYYWGITGIILATILTIFVCNFITRTNVLFKNYFNSSPKPVYRQHFVCFIAFILNCILTYWLCSFVSTTGIIGLILKSIICLIVPNSVYMLLYYRTDQFTKCKAFIMKVIQQ